MEHGQLRGLTPTLGGVLSAFGLVTLVLLLTATHARAEEQPFCTGKSLPLFGEGGVCTDSTARWITGVYGTGSQATCVGAWEGPKFACASAGQGVYVGSPYYKGAESLKAVIYNNSPYKGNKVYGTVWSNPEGPPTPPPPPPSWHIQNLGGVANSDPEISSWGPNRRDVWVRGTDNALWHKWWDGSWHGWESLGGKLASGPGAVEWGQGRIDVVARAENNSVLHWWWNGSTWQSENIGGNITWDPDISSWGTNRLDIWGRAPDGSIAHKWWDGSSWKGWEYLGGPEAVVSGVGAVGEGGDRIDVVGRAPNKSVFHLWWNGSSWQTENMGGEIQSDPDISTWGASRFDLWARGTDNELWHRWWPGSIWMPWEDQSPSATYWSSPGAVSVGDNETYIVGREPDNSVVLSEWRK
jgi:hypothetical protein